MDKVEREGKDDHKGMLKELPLTVTREQLAAELQVSTKSIDNWWREGLLPRPVRIGRAVRFVRSEVVAALGKNRA